MQSAAPKAIFAALLALLGSYLIPWVLRYPTLLGLNRTWQPDPQFAHLKDTCQWLHPDQLLGCEKFKIVGSFLFAACVGDWEVRKKWFPPMAKFDALADPQGIIRDHVYKLNLEESPANSFST
ncbi:hypothetical protein ABW19_dt0207213 [Dactylella cylindrospora]|nr:hypothetical protein ABW19_dt0207213 [Dactylella cylindrospora]